MDRLPSRPLSRFPLTDFIIALDKTPENLTRADPAIIAKQFGLTKAEHLVRGYLDAARN